MAIIKPFKALRPQAQLAKGVASRPYDVLSSKEAKVEAQGNPISFLHVTKSEIYLPDSTDIYSPEVYQKAKENLTAFIKRDVLFRENKECYYLYRLTMKDKSQTGLVCVSSVDDYENDVIKKHEFTRPQKEQDRINHITTTGAQTGNVFMAYRNVAEIDELINLCKTKNPVYSFLADDGIEHTIWIVNDDAIIAAITKLFAEAVPSTYIADGHHRAASAAKVRGALNKPNREAADYFLTTLFPASQLHIMDYNRLVKDLNGFTPKQLLEKISEDFVIEKKENEKVKPSQEHQFGMYLDGCWYLLTAKENTFAKDAIGILDVSILQNNILGKWLGIKDARTDSRIDFVGGIRGLEELEQRVNNSEMKVAFSLFPVSIEQLFSVAD
ncbi:MAG: DUF1015 domain-containing protein, partial [Bacteroidota bacterium]|nr:DUF1015 domain-containing protein [Bacteroidota bacterium]